MRKLIITIITFVTFTGFSQENRTLNGYVSSEKTGEKLIGATIYDTVFKVGTITNEYGFFSLTIPNQPSVLKIHYTGFNTELKDAPIKMNELNIYLKEVVELNEVVVTAHDTKRNIERTNIGTLELSLDKVNKLPVLMGERDVLKILQLMPGVKSGGEGSAGIYVRGGGPDQNLILLDGVPVYNPSHLFGFFSVFNSDALSQVTLTKGGFPARYGGRVSSVLDMRMKEGNNRHYNVEGSIGSIASRLLVEGPLKKNKGAFIVSGRRTYLDILLRPLMTKEQNMGYYFYDLNTKVNYELNNKHHFYLSGYFGKDKAQFNSTSIYQNTKFESKMGLGWGNTIAAARWNYRISPKLFCNTTFTYSKYLFNVGISESEFSNAEGESSQSSYSIQYLSGIDDWAGKSDFTFTPNTNHTIKFGIGDIYHTFKPGINLVSTSVENVSTESKTGSSFTYAHETFIYLENDHKITNRLKINYGIHHSSFFVNSKQYHQLQPRISGNFRLTENASIKLGYAKTAQFLHLLSNIGIGLPTDLWVPATENIPPVTADQLSIGYNQEIKRNYSLVVEAYYKKMNNLIQYKEGASFLNKDTDWQNKVESGQGWSYGLEVFLQKTKGKFTGWIGYTLSRTERQFDNLNKGQIFPYRYDRTHDVSLVLTYEINSTWDVGCVFVYGTGNAVTLASQTYNVADNPLTGYNLSGSWVEYKYGVPSKIDHISSINNYRMPDYHRMDFSANRTRTKNWGKSVLSFSVYNLYNRINPYYLVDP